MFRTLCSALLIPGSILLSNAAQAQQDTTVAGKAYLITRLASRYHVSPRPLDAAMGESVYSLFLNQLDEDRRYFTQDELVLLKAHRPELHKEIAERKAPLPALTTRLLNRRLQQVDSLLKQVAGKPFVFTTNEIYTEAEDSTAPANTAALLVKWQKQWKLAVLQGMARGWDNLAVKPADNRRKAWLDSAETAGRKRLVRRQQQQWQRLLNRPGGLGGAVNEAYLEAIAASYDPHTNYLSQTGNEQLSEVLGQNTYAFGFSLAEENDGTVTVGDLVPGSPAFTSGQLSKGDVIESVQWGQQPPIDVAEATEEELLHVLGMSNHEVATLALRKPDGTRRQVALTKAKTGNQDEEIKVRSYLMQGDRKVGYIMLPSFYTDWESDAGTNGCANDVAREVVKLKKEGMEALVLDLRYNGGGSLGEAVELAGIFVDAGPMVQIKTKLPKVGTEKDVNRGTVYDGPMLVLVNGYSASASELVAAALQDWHRAVIVGSTTYGKATGQAVFPLDTVLAASEGTNPAAQAGINSFLKITRMQLFRINGTTAQFQGVIPDIILPDYGTEEENREKDEPNALPPTTIDPNKYYTPLPALPLARLQEQAVQGTKADSVMQQLVKAAASHPKTPGSWPLQWNAFLAQYQQYKAATALEDTAVSANRKTGTPVFTLTTPAQPGATTMQAPGTEEMDLRALLTLDPYLRMAYRLASSMAK